MLSRFHLSAWTMSFRQLFPGDTSSPVVRKPKTPTRKWGRTRTTSLSRRKSGPNARGLASSRWNCPPTRYTITGNNVEPPFPGSCIHKKSNQLDSLVNSVAPSLRFYIPYHFSLRSQDQVQTKQNLFAYMTKEWRDEMNITVISSHGWEY